MDETAEKVSPTEDKTKVLESPKPLAFTIDFGEKKPIDTQRFKNLVEKYQQRHRRGQSLSKIEEPVIPSTKKHPLTENLPRKSGYHVEGYYSSDEKVEKFKTQGARSTVLNSVMLKGELTLPLKGLTSDRMTQSYPNRTFDLPVINSPEVEIKNISSPELESNSPISPLVSADKSHSYNKSVKSASKLSKQLKKADYSKSNIKPSTSSSSDDVTLEKFVSCMDFELDKSDSVSDAGTYTIETDNYTEEQKARITIDKDFNIQQVSVIEKTQEYIQSLVLGNKSPDTKKEYSAQNSKTSSPVNEHNISQCIAYNKNKPELHNSVKEQKANSAIAQTSLQTEIQYAQTIQNNLDCDQLNNVNEHSYNKILYPSLKSQNGDGIEQNIDKGVFTLVTTSGVLNKRPEKKSHVRQHSLAKSEILVETYPGNVNSSNAQVLHTTVHVAKHEQTHNGLQRVRETVSSAVHPTLYQRTVSPTAPRKEKEYTTSRVVNLPPSVGGTSGKSTPSKIPSPSHITRPRSHNSYGSQNYDFSDSSLETESYLQPTQNIITSLQARLSIESDPDSDCDKKYNLSLNNEAKILLKNKPVHVRNNSFDDRNIKMPNKLEHFHSKNLQGIDQTFKTCNQYYQSRTVQRIQNSPNNSPIKRSNSFSMKNQFNNQPKCVNTTPVNKDNNYYNSPGSQRSGSIQRSASTASIKPKVEQLRRASINLDNPVQDRRRYVDTESSSDEDIEKTVMKNKKDLTNTRYNRAFSLRRARLDVELPIPKCPNTPEMKRKFITNDKTERTVSVDRKGTKSADIQSRYMNITKSNKTISPKPEPPKTLLKYTPKAVSTKSAFSRTDSGRFSLRTPKPASAGPIKPTRRDQQQNKKQSGPRSNSTLSSREVEFQNWKRRKSYDPMKAAAEGKRKAELARKQNIMTQSYNEGSQEYDSSPTSHSSSVHRSQSFHGTAALEQHLISSEDDEDLTLSGDDGFSPPTPSPCVMSPTKSNARHVWHERFAKH